MANDYKYRADVIGRLVPPESVEGAPTAEQLDSWSKRALQMQIHASLACGTDGEYRRHNLALALAERGRTGAAPQLVADEAGFALGVAGKRLALKISMPAPSDVVRQVAEHAASTGAAFDAEATGAAAVAALKAEIDALIEAGVLYVQLNTSGYDRFLGPDGALAPLQQAAALDASLLSQIKRPDNVRIGFRFGRTGKLPVWSLEGGGLAKLETLFALPADRLLIDFGIGPSDFSALKAVTGNAHVVLGLLCSNYKNRQTTDALLNQVDLAAKERSGDLLSVSPRGGFNAASGITWAQQKDVLEQTVEVATRWWGFAL
jgi:methionine synthase II (cobalamin-independent)